jgi:hypothetical protein
LRDDILLPQQLHWLVQAVSASSAMFTMKATTISPTQRFCSLLHMGGIEADSASISVVRWDTAHDVYKVVQDSL